MIDGTELFVTKYAIQESFKNHNSETVGHVQGEARVGPFFWERGERGFMVYSYEADESLTLKSIRECEDDTWTGPGGKRR